MKPPFHRGPAPATGGQSFTTAPRIVSVSPSSARSTGGATITLSGYDFILSGSGAVPTVTVGGVAALNVVVVDRNTLTFEMPAVSFVGVVDIVMTTQGGSNTLTGIFNVYASTLVSVNLGYGSISGGYERTVIGYNFVTGSTFTIGGVAATGVTFIDSEHYIITIPAHGKGFVDVVITDPGGATSTLKGGYQYTLFTRGEDIRRQPGIVINDSLNSAPNTCDFLVDGDSNVPLEGEEIQIVDSEDGDRLLFAGTVQSVDQNFEGQIDQLTFNVRCVDFTFLLNKYRPFGKFSATSASDIVKALIGKYAPDFGTTYVQTNLAPVSHEFDGSRDMATCLSDIAASIGGGHWYVDYDREIHFFHVVPPGQQLPSLPNTNINQDFGSPMTVATAGSIPSTTSYPRGWYRFTYSIYYDNNLESTLGPWSNWIYLDGSQQLQFSNIPTGSVIGSINPSKRRIYFNRLLHTGKTTLDTIERYVQIDNAVDTGFTSWFGTEGASSSAIVNIPGTEALPRKPYAGHPEGPAGAVSLGVVTWTGGRTMNSGAFRVAFMYRDGSVSYAGPSCAPNWSPAIWTNNSTVTGWNGWNISGIPTGPTVDGVDCVARLLYFGWHDYEKFPPYSQAFPPSQGGGGVAYPFPNGSPTIPTPDWNPSRTLGVILVGDNTTSSITHTSLSDIQHTQFDQYQFVGGIQPFFKAGEGGLQFEDEPIPVWPNADGPWLEDGERPDDIDDANTDLLFDPQITVNRDLSQIRNRVYLIGRGTVLTEAASIGDLELQVADGNAFSRGGGTVAIRGQQYGYATINGADGVWVLLLSDPLRTSVVSGEEITNFLQGDDIESQKALGKIELLKNGSKSDGVHEYTIVDTSLKTQFQMYSRMNAELELFGRPIVTVNYSTRDPKSRSGRLVNIDLTSPPISGEFLIQSVSIDQIHDDADMLAPRYNVRASSVKYDLSDLLLQILKSNNVTGGSTVGVASAAQAASALASVSTINLNYIVVTIPRATLMLMNSANPLQILSAPQAHQIIAPIWFVLETNIITGSGTNPNLNFRWTDTSTVVAFGTATINTQRHFFNFTDVIDTIPSLTATGGPSTTMDEAGKGVEVYLSALPSALFNGSIRLHIAYSVLDEMTF